MISEVQKGSLSELPVAVHGDPEWIEGRWPEKTAVRLDNLSPDRPEYLGISESDSEAFNFESSFSIAIWFRTEQFTRNYETLISKGDHSFRISRQDDLPYVMFAINEYGGRQRVPVPVPMAKVLSEKNVADGRWHLAVGTLQEQKSRHFLRFYIDGALQGTSLSLHLQVPTDDPVLIGANSWFVRPDSHPESGRRLIRNFSGDVGEVALFSRTLSPEEVRSMYEAGRP